MRALVLGRAVVVRVLRRAQRSVEREELLLLGRQGVALSFRGVRVLVGRRELHAQLSRGVFGHRLLLRLLRERRARLLELARGALNRRGARLGRRLLLGRRRERGARLLQVRLQPAEHFGGLALELLFLRTRALCLSDGTVYSRASEESNATLRRETRAR